jgi:CRISPR-associated endonuclease/helicase Cas3
VPANHRDNRSSNFWAHSDPTGLKEDDPGASWQRLADHLRQVARISAHLASLARPGDSNFQRDAFATGMLHDIGKYALSFQQMIRGEIRNDPGGHAARGAALAWLPAKAREAAFAIVGHHSGIPNPNDGSTSLLGRIGAAKDVANALRDTAIADCPEISEALAILTTSPKPAGRDLHTRMLFSCLVDADRLDSASRPLSQEILDPVPRLKRLLDYIDVRAANVQDGPVKTVRAEVLEDCLAAGAFTENLLTLTVPTGGGKTLASVAFALRRAIVQPEKVRRIIVVIPYLSIIEQNASVFADALGSDAILEHHSGNFERLKLVGNQFQTDSDDSEINYRAAVNPATENWDAPIVVTTSVRFFESIFSNKPSDLRRLHNVARSVVILDEVQTLPRKFLNPLLSAMRGLARDWDTTFVFCTATQPAFEKPVQSDRNDPRWPKGEVREVVRHPAKHFQTLRRVAVEWELDQSLSWSDLAARMLQSNQSLAIVNLRAHAAQLFQSLRTFLPGHKSIFHLSTRMCAAHRLRKLAEIRALVMAGKPCIVASTQLIEAGVDLDFPAVFRALAPLDSIVQAAGRCDREGLLTAALGAPGGRLTVFRTEDGKTPPNEYKEATDITSTMARAAPLSIDDPAIITKYFNRYYGDADADSLGLKLEEARDQAQFLDIAKEFRMIADYTQDVFVPWNAESRALIQQLDVTGVVTSGLRRGLQRYVVGLTPGEFLKAKRGAIRQIRDTGLWVCLEGMYSDDLGIVLEPDAASMVL